MISYISNYWHKTEAYFQIKMLGLCVSLTPIILQSSSHIHILTPLTLTQGYSVTLLYLYNIVFSFDR